MDDRPPNSRWSESAHCPRSTEPATEVEAEIRAILTPGGQVDVPGSMADQPSDGSLPAYEASRPSYVHRTSFTPPPSHAWDEWSKKDLREHLDNMLHPFADALKPVEEVALHEWLRATIWWARWGHLGLEHTRLSSEMIDERLSLQRASQGLMNLAKAWWICNQVLAQDDFKLRMASSSIKGGPHCDLFDQYRAVLTYLRRYEGDIASFVCGGTKSAETFDLDKRLWVLYPQCTAYEAALLNDDDRGQAWNLNVPPLVFGDTNNLFSYKSEFVDVTLVAQEEHSLPTSSKFQCLFSIVRDPSSWHTVGTIASQTQLVYLEIHSNRSQYQDPVWKDINWDITQQSMLIKLRRPGCFVNVKFSDEGSFRANWELVQQIILRENGLAPGKDEELLFNETVKCCQYLNHDRPIEFPAKPTPHCRVRLLRKTTTGSYGTVQRKAYSGLRIVVATPPQIKILHQVSHDLHNSCPLSYTMLDEDTGSPGIRLDLFKEDEKCSLFIYFAGSAARALFLSLIQDLVPFPGETAPKRFSTTSYTISQQSSCQEQSTEETQFSRLELGESQTYVIEQDSEPEFGRTPYGKAVLSEHLRVIVETEWGTITDRFNIGPGMLRMALPVHDNTVIHLYRLPQKDLSMTVLHDLVGKNLMARITRVLPAIQVKPSLRTIKFKSQEDLHKFQETVTGFQVLFDSIATRFLITRRRRLLPLLKQWDTNIARVQVVQQGNKFQIVAFFHSFRHWKCLNFRVTELDEFESVEQPGEWGVRIIDAKYALPQPQSGNGSDSELSVSDSVCLDELEYPTEHDDVAIMFGDALVRDAFASCLPGLTTTRHASRFLRSL
ncbi:hypothetical protein BDW60DRAFT_220068 [Aspergillus nidulans var. acristatus]